MTFEEGIKIVRADPPSLADIDRPELAVLDPASYGDLVDLQEVRDLLDGPILLA